MSAFFFSSHLESKMELEVHKLCFCNIYWFLTCNIAPSQRFVIYSFPFFPHSFPLQATLQEMLSHNKLMCLMMSRAWFLQPRSRHYLEFKIKLTFLLWETRKQEKCDTEQFKDFSLGIPHQCSDFWRVFLAALPIPANTSHMQKDRGRFTLSSLPRNKLSKETSHSQQVLNSPTLVMVTPSITSCISH